MTAASLLPSAGGLRGIAVSEVHDEYRRRGVDSWSDRQVLGAASVVLSVPKVAPADSFVLHAPLELLARAGLLGRVRPDAHEAARLRIVGLAAAFEAAGDGLDVPDPLAAEAGGALDGLLRALDAGDLSAVDRYAAHLGAHATPAELRAVLAAPVSASLAAAGHASIFLNLFPRIAPDADLSGAMLRGLARELGRHPDWRLRWFDDPGEPAVTAALADALVDVPVLGLPGSDFIYPLMAQAENSGLAPRLLQGVVAAGAGLEVTAARRDLSRVAAWSMLQEPPLYAPYGWSHCLTMPQAVMGLAADALDARAAVAIAATHVVGFRTALGTGPIVSDYAPERFADAEVMAALDHEPAVAAAAVWHAPNEQLDGVITELATRASLHHDAHLVKYTLACFDAAAADPEYARLYVAAAAYLSAWWSAQPGDGFFGA